MRTSIWILNQGTPFIAYPQAHLPLHSHQRDGVQGCYHDRAAAFAANVGNKRNVQLAQLVLDSAADTKPTGDADDQPRLGLAFFTRRINSSSAVGALPIA